jgi:hypothetical protein
LLLTSVERARKSHTATLISDAFFRALRNILDTLPSYLIEDEGELGIGVWNVLCEQLKKYFPPTNAASATSNGNGLGDTQNMNISLNTTNSADGAAGGGQPSFSDFAGALGLTSTSNTASVNTAWTALKVTLLQMVTVCAYALQGGLLARLASSTQQMNHASLFSSLFIALQSSEEEVRKAATTAWCLLRDAYPVALAALLTEEERDASEEGKAYALANVRGFVDLIISTLLAPPPNSLTLSKMNSGSSSPPLGSPTNNNEKGLDRDVLEVLRDDLPTTSFGTGPSSSPPPPLGRNGVGGLDESPKSLASSGVGSSGVTGSLPPVELEWVMLDLVLKVVKACGKTLKQQHALPHDTLDSNGKQILLQSVPVSDEFSRLTNFVTGLLETECTRPMLRSILLMQQYWTILQGLVHLTRATPIQPSAVAVEDVEEIGSTVVTGTIATATTAGPPTLTFPILPASTLPTFQLRTSSVLSDASTYHAFLLPLINVTCDHCAHSAPKEELLQLLVLVLATVKPEEVAADKHFSNSLTRLFALFTNWIPHSVFDDTFELFQTLLHLLESKLSPSLLIQILQAFTNKYTVRSQAYRYARDIFIQCVIKQLCSFVPPTTINNAASSGVTGTGSNEQDSFLYLDHLLHHILSLPVTPPSVPPSDFTSLTAPVKPIKSTITKGARGANSEQVGQWELWQAGRFEQKKLEEQRKELISFAIQFLATLVQRVSKADSLEAPKVSLSHPAPVQLQHFHSVASSPTAASSANAKNNSEHALGDKVSGYTLALQPLQTFLALFGPPLVASCCASITSANNAQRLDAVVLAGLVSSLLAWVRTSVPSSPHPVSSLLASFFHVATVRGCELNDADLTYAGLVHAWNMIRAGRTHAASDAHQSQQTDLILQVWTTARKVQAQTNLALSVRQFAQWIMLQLADETANGGETVLKLQEHIFPVCLSLSQAKNHWSRLLSLQILAVSFRLLSSHTSPLSFSSIPPFLRSPSTPFQEAPTPIETLSALQDFSLCAGDLEFFSVGGLKVDGASSVHTDHTTSSATKALVVAALPKSVLELQSWFDARPASSSSSSNASSSAQQLKSLIHRLLRDWHSLVASSARMLYDFLDFSAKVQVQSSTKNLAASPSPPPSPPHRAEFHAHLASSDWLVFSGQIGYPSDALFSSNTASTPAAASPEILFDWQQEAAELGMLETYANILSSVASPMGSALGKEPYNFESAKADDLFEHIAHIYSYALEAKAPFGSGTSDKKRGTDGPSFLDSLPDAFEQEMSTAGGEDESWNIESASADSTDEIWDADGPPEDLNKAQKIKTSPTKKGIQATKKKGAGAAAGKGKGAQMKKNVSPVKVLTAAQKLAALSPHAPWQAHIARCFQTGAIVATPLSPAQFDMLFFRALKVLLDSCQAQAKKDELDVTSSTVDLGNKPVSPTASRTKLGLGGASSMGASIAEELARMVKALENAEGEDEDEDDEDLLRGSGDIDEEDESGRYQDDEDDEDGGDRRGGSSYPPAWPTAINVTHIDADADLYSSVVDAEERDSDEIHGPPDPGSSSASGSLAKPHGDHGISYEDDGPQEDEDDDDNDYEDEPLIDESELAEAASKAKSSSTIKPPPVSSDFRAAVKQTAKDHIASLKTSSNRPRKQQSAVSGSSSSAAGAKESGDAHTPPKSKPASSSFSLTAPPPPQITKSPELTGWEGADPDDMGQATSRVPAGGRKRPESAGRRRGGVQKRDQEMDQLDELMSKQPFREKPTRGAPSKEKDTPASLSNRPQSASSASTAKPKSASILSASAVSHATSKINIPKTAFALPLPISTAVGSSRPKSATTSAGSTSSSSSSSASSKPIEISFIPSSASNDVLVEEFFEEDDGYPAPTHSSLEKPWRAEENEHEAGPAEPKEKLVDSSSVASDGSIHASAANVGMLDAEEDPLTFSVHLASKDPNSSPTAGGHDSDDDEVPEENELNRTSSSTSSIDPSTPNKFHVQASQDEQDEMRQDSEEDDEDAHDSDQDSLNTSSQNTSSQNTSISSPPLRTRGRGASPEEESDEDDVDDRENGEMDSEEEELARQMEEMDEDSGEDFDETPMAAAPNKTPGFGLSALAALAQKSLNDGDGSQM